MCGLALAASGGAASRPCGFDRWRGLRALIARPLIARQEITSASISRRVLMIAPGETAPIADRAEARPRPAITCRLLRMARAAVLNDTRFLRGNPGALALVAGTPSL